jgi:hypothetical protein
MTYIFGSCCLLYSELSHNIFLYLYKFVLLLTYYKYLPMIQRIFFITFFILCSCDSDDGEVYDITITGTVSDQATKQPVEGATVSVGIQPGAMPGDGLIYAKSSTLSGADGKYKLVTQSESVKDLGSVPIGKRGYCIAVIASKAGYAGCDRREIYYFNAQNSVLNIELHR